MGKLTSKGRSELPKSDFGEPASRKYPMPDASHAANAKARATQQEEKGNISASTKSKIDAKADKKLGERDKRAPHEKMHDGMSSAMGMDE